METTDVQKDDVLVPNYIANHKLPAYGPMPSRSIILERIMKKYRGLDTKAMRSFMQGAVEVTESILLDYTRKPSQDWDIQIASSHRGKVHECTRCQGSLYSYYHYCPGCGAKIKWL